MGVEQMISEIGRLPEPERQRLLALIETWLTQYQSANGDPSSEALRTVQQSWATTTLDPATARWVAEDVELEYEPG